MLCPTPYKRIVWDYDKADVHKIKADLSAINWNIAFHNINIDDCVIFLNHSLVTIFTRSIPNKTITVNDKDAPWVTPELKSAIRRNDRTYKRWKDRGKPPTGKRHVQDIQLITNSIITEAKAEHLSRLSRKLTDPLSSPNIFWSATRRLINSRKMTNIPQLKED